VWAGARAVRFSFLGYNRVRLPATLHVHAARQNMTFEPLPEKPAKKKPAGASKNALRRPRRKSLWEQYRVLIIAAVAGLGLLTCLAAVAGGLYVNSLNQPLPTVAAPTGAPGSTALATLPLAGATAADDGGAGTNSSGGSIGGSAVTPPAQTTAPGATGAATGAPAIKATFTGTPTPLGGERPTFTPYASETPAPTWTRAPDTSTPTETATEPAGPSPAPATRAPTQEATRKVG
jgi:hypothetical protein